MEWRWQSKRAKPRPTARCCCFRDSLIPPSCWPKQVPAATVSKFWLSRHAQKSCCKESGSCWRARFLGERLASSAKLRKRPTEAARCQVEDPLHQIAEDSTLKLRTAHNLHCTASRRAGLPALLIRGSHL